MTIQSPCIGVCELVENTNYCAGCFRSNEEIRIWKTSPDATKINIIEKLNDRYNALMHHPEPMFSGVDQIGNLLILQKIPQRIVSLVPSQTELLFDLGLENQIVGVTQFCTRPAHALSTKTVIGGTKNIRFDAIAALAPDLIVGNKEENTQEIVTQLQQHYPVWLSDIHNFAQAMEMIIEVGKMTNQAQTAIQLVDKIQIEFERFRVPKRYRVTYLIWRKPWIVVGKDTFVDHLLNFAGFDNAAGHCSRYQQISTEELGALDTDFIFLSSEPFPFTEKHLTEIQSIHPTAKPRVVDGELFSWYGSRLQFAPAYYRVLHAH